MTAERIAHSLDANASPSRRMEALCVFAPALIGLGFSMTYSGSALLFGDEFHSLRNLHLSYGELIAAYDGYGTGVPLPILQKAAIDVFGPSLWAYRWPAIAGAFCALIMMYPLAKRLVGAEPAALASFALAANGMHIFYSHFARSYALVVFFGLLLVWATLRAMEPEKPSLWRYLLFAGAGGVMPWFHLSSAAFVAGIAGAAVAYAMLTQRPRGHLAHLAISLLLIPAICLALYMPSFGDLWNFVNARAGFGREEPFTVLDVMGLLAGSPALGIVWAIGLPIAVAAFCIREFRKAVFLVAAIAAPVTGMLVMRPDGMAYAYARYLLPALPFALMLLSWLVVRIASALVKDANRGRYFAFSVGFVLIALNYAAGPLGWRHVDDGPFANNYLSMMPLPAFESKWSETPAFYAELGTDSKAPIVEIPELVSRAALLYRNYYFQHGRPIVIGTLIFDPPNVPGGPYVHGADVTAMRARRAEYVVVHRNLEEELPQYFRFVFDEVWASNREAGLDSYMARHRSFHQERVDVAPAIAALEKECGPPVFEDRFVSVWRLRESVQSK